MKRHTITLGASTTAGGKVISASSHGSIHGVIIALEGDLIFCPACKSQGTIQCIAPRIPELWNDKNVALENDLCICGCLSPPRLLPSQSVRYQIIGEAAVEARQAAERSIAAEAWADAGAMFDDRYILIDEESGEPFANTEYALQRRDGQVEFGITDAQGHTHLLTAAVQAETIHIYA